LAPIFSHPEMTGRTGKLGTGANKTGKEFDKAEGEEVKGNRLPQPTAKEAFAVFAPPRLKRQKRRH
jgi:hypothetical protein